MEGRRLELGNDGQKKSMEEEEITITSGKGIMLFGVRVMEAAAAGGCFRKSASMNNLAHYPHHQADSNADVVAGGYASDDVVHPSARSRERKRGVPWSEEEHKLFLMGLQKVGKGDWRGISRNFVKTRTPTQVASHAQKYFLRLNNHNRRRRRSSLFDITTHTFKDSLMEDHHDFHQKTPSRSPLHPLHQKNKGFPVSVFPANGENSIENLTLGQSNLIRTLPSVPVPPSSKMAHLNLNHTSSTEPMPNLSLEISAPSPSSSSDQQSPAPERHGTGFQGTSGSFNSSGGDSIISVA